MGGHTVEVEEGAAESVFDEYARQEYIPKDRQLPPPQGGLEEAAQPGSDWQQPANLIASIINAKFIPAWEVDRETQEEWAKSLAECLDDIMPGGLGNIAAWGPWAKLAFATGSVVMCGIDFETMTFKPRHYIQEEEEEQSADPGEPQAPPRPRQSNSGRFETGV